MTLAGHGQAAEGADATPGPWRHWPWVVLVLATAITVAPVWLARYFPTMDGPQHLLMGAMADRFEALGFARYFEPTGYRATPILGHLLLRALFALGLAAPLAQRIFLTLWIVAWAAACGYACSFRHRDGVARAAAGLLLVHGLSLSMGFFEYLWSIPCGVAALGVLLRDARLATPRRWGAFVALLTLSSLAHPFTVVVLAPVLLGVVWAAGGSWQRVLASLLPGAGAVGASFLGVSEVAGTPPIWMSAYGGLKALVADGFAGIADARVLGWVGFLALLAVALRRARERRLLLVLVAAALACGLAAVLMPVSALGWDFLKLRFVPFFWLFTLLALCLAPVRRAAIPVAIVVAALAAQSALVARTQRPFDLRIREVAQVSAAVPPGSRLLPLVFDARGGSYHPWLRPYAHVWAYVLMERGGVTPYVFANAGIHPFHFRQKWPAPSSDLDTPRSCARVGAPPDSPACARYQRGFLRWCVDHARGYDAVLAFQPPPGLEPALREAAFERAAGTEHVAVYLRRPGGAPP